MSIVDKKLFLASGSPRRKELMEQMGLQFEILNTSVEENILPKEAPDAYVVRVAKEKSQSGLKMVDENESWVVGGDTLIVLESEVLGKPRDRHHAKSMLLRLSGKKHSVLSAIAISTSDQVIVELNTTVVSFKSLTDTEIEQYILSGEPEGKAGSYAIQGLGACFINRIEGSFSAVMGLPIFELNQLLKQSGYKQ